MSKERKHAHLIRAWAGGEEIEVYVPATGEWEDAPNPLWSDKAEYRVKPSPTPCQMENYKVGDVFYVKKPVYWSNVRPLVVKLLFDDSSFCPKFQIVIDADGKVLQHEDTLYIGLDDLVKIENPFANPFENT